MKMITSPFASIDKNTITLYDTKDFSTHSNHSHHKNVVISIDENNGLVTFTSDKINYTLNFQENWDEEEVNSVVEESIREGYRNIFDWFRGKKSKYVKIGWSALKETTPFKMETTKYMIIYA